MAGAGERGPVELESLFDRDVPADAVAHEPAHPQLAVPPVHAAAQLGGEGAAIVVGRVEQPDVDRPDRHRRSSVPPAYSIRIVTRPGTGPSAWPRQIRSIPSAPMPAYSTSNASVSGSCARACSRSPRAGVARPAPAQGGDAEGHAAPRNEQRDAAGGGTAGGHGAPSSRGPAVAMVSWAALDGRESRRPALTRDLNRISTAGEGAGESLNGGRTRQHGGMLPCSGCWMGRGAA